MKKIALALMLVTVVAWCGAEFVLAAEAAAPQANHVVVYYFHTNFRCPSCYNMEKWTRELVDSDFQGEQAIGKLTLKIINVETKGNKHYISDYGLFTKSVVLSLVKDGKEVKFNNLGKVWDFLRSGDKFKAYVKDEISKYLKEL
ncbi:MAG: nitrophenyl compound nitroreductase subunit ArsF family protein [Candidatus Omnitrophica bacterium]|nr:nitrophenyl compound nitroreductase subunit ArsF family protein [Candidatus Omnitrophota bacterium]MCM8791113.1 nitrophenyl compound nitroreductase subunit ArsF family protein [Candidatus Omnitrophota bacterium]